MTVALRPTIKPSVLQALDARRGRHVAVRCPRVERVEPVVPDPPGYPSDEDEWVSAMHQMVPDKNCRQTSRKLVAMKSFWLQDDEDEDEFDDDGDLGDYWEGDDIHYDADMMGSESDDGMDEYAFQEY